MNTVIEVFRHHADTNGAKECLAVYPSGQPALTYAQLYQLLINKSHLFKAHYDLQAGDTVAMIADNSLEYLILTFSAMFAGVRVMLVSTKTAAANIPYFLEQSGSKVLFRSAGYVDFVDQALAAQAPAEELLLADLSLFSVQKQDIESGSREGLPGCNSEDTALILHTSGSTAKPKLVHLSHKNILANQYAAADRNASFWTDREISFSWLPLFHAYGLLGEFMVDMFAGGKFILFDKPENMAVEDIIQGLEQTRATVFCAVPWMLESIREKIMAEQESGAESHTLDVMQGLKFIVTAGSPLPLKVGEFYGSNNIVIISSFGMTEAAGSFLFSDFDENRPDILYPVKNAGLQFVVNEQSGSDKEMVFENSDLISESTAEDYYNQGPSENRKGYFATGDLFQEYQSGWRYISRKDHIFNSLHGEKVNPVHFEEKLEQLDSVERAWVFGENRPFNTAFIELKSSGENKEQLKSEINRYIHESANPALEMPARVYPNDVVFLEQGEHLPRTAKGNVDRKKAAELFGSKVSDTSLGEQGSSATKLGKEDLHALVLAEVRKYLQTSGNSFSSEQVSLLELGFDSLMLMSLKNSLEARLAIKIPTEYIFSFPTLGEFTAEVYARHEKSASDRPAGKESSKGTDDGWHNILLEQVPYHTAYFNLPYATFNVTMSLVAPGRLSRNEIDAAIRKLESHNGMLRSIYTEDGKFRIQDRSYADTAFFDEITLNGPHDIYRNEAARRLINDFQNIRVDYEEGPIYRYAIIHLKDKNGEIRSLIYFELNHVATDFYGLNLIMRQIMDYLQKPDSVVEDDHYVQHIPDVSASQREQYAEHWRKIFLAPRVENKAGSDPTLGGARQFSFPHINLDDMAKLLARHQITLFNGLYSAWILALTNCIPDLKLEKFSSITPLSMRHNAGIENLVGCFLELAPLTFRLNEDDDIRQLMSSVQQTTTKAFQDILTDRVAYLGDIVSDKDNLIPVVDRNIFLYRTQAEIMQPLPGWDFYRNEFFSDRSQPGLTLDICADPEGKGVEGYIRFNFNYCSADLVEAIVTELERLLLAILKHPELDIDHARLNAAMPPAKPEASPSQVKA